MRRNQTPLWDARDRHIPPLAEAARRFQPRRSRLCLARVHSVVPCAEQRLGAPVEEARTVLREPPHGLDGRVPPAE